MGDTLFGPGSSVRVKQAEQPPATWVVTEWEEGGGFTWESARPGLKMTATHHIEPWPSAIARSTGLSRSPRNA
jgi:hypothetical protein